MKLRKFLAISMTAAIIFTACGQGGDASENSPSPSQTALADLESKDVSVQGTIDEYFPFFENAYYVYDRSDANSISNTYNIYVDGNRMQRVTKSGRWLVTEVLEYADGRLTVNYAHNSSSGFENMLNEKDEYVMTILEEPLQLGNSWNTYSGPTVQGVAKGVSTITDVGVEVSTPYGTFPAIEVSTVYESEYTNVDYYAKGLGLIKSGYFIKGFEKTTEEGTTTADDVATDMALEKFSEDESYRLDINIYYPNENVDDLSVSEMIYLFKTNDSMEAVFEDLLKSPTGNETARVISDNTTINSIDVIWEYHTDPETKVYSETATVHVDLSRDFSEDMNAGSGYEQLLLQSLEYTFREFYKAQEFVLTLDGEPYAGKH